MIIVRNVTVHTAYLDSA